MNATKFRQKRKSVEIMPDLIKEPKENVIVGDEVFVPLLTEEQIQKRIAELGEEVTKDYEGSVPVFIGVLNGSFQIGRAHV